MATSGIKQVYIALDFFFFLRLRDSMQVQTLSYLDHGNPQRLESRQVDFFFFVLLKPIKNKKISPVALIKGIS